MNIIKVGLIGYGRIGKLHSMIYQLIPIILEQNEFVIDMKKICSRKKSDIPFVSSKQVYLPDEVTQDPNIDVVDICTPNFTHEELAIEAIQNNKAVYLEKPLAMSYKGAHSVTREAKKVNVINQTSLIYRFIPGVIGIKEMVQNGEIGEIVNFQIRALHSGYLDAKRPTAWNLKRNTSGGGPILDLGIHVFDFIRFVMGEVQYVISYGDTLIKKRPKYAGSEELTNVDVEDWGRIYIQLKNSGFGTVEVSRVASLMEEETTFEIMGTKGSFRFNLKQPWLIEHYNQGTGVKQFIKYSPDSAFGKHVCNYYPQGSVSMGWYLDAHFACLLNFYHNIRAGRVVHPETPTFDEGLKAQAIVESCYISLQNKNRMQSIDSDNEL